MITKLKTTRIALWTLCLTTLLFLGWSTSTGQVNTKPGAGFALFVITTSLLLLTWWGCFLSFQDCNQRHSNATLTEKKKWIEHNIFFAMVFVNLLVLFCVSLIHPFLSVTLAGAQALAFGLSLEEVGVVCCRIVRSLTSLVRENDNTQINSHNNIFVALNADHGLERPTNNTLFKQILSNIWFWLHKDERHPVSEKCLVNTALFKTDKLVFVSLPRQMWGELAVGLIDSAVDAEACVHTQDLSAAVCLDKLVFPLGKHLRLHSKEFHNDRIVFFFEKTSHITAHQKMAIKASIS